MSFRFIARTQENKTVTVKVQATREHIARTKLTQAGYEVVAMIGVEAVEQPNLVVHKAKQAVRSLFPGKELLSVPSKALRLKLRWTSVVCDFFAPFNLLG